MNFTVRFGNSFLRVPLMYQPSCLVPCHQGKLGKLSKISLQHLQCSSFCLSVMIKTTDINWGSRQVASSQWGTERIEGRSAKNDASHDELIVTINLARLGMTECGSRKNGCEVAAEHKPTIAPAKGTLCRLVEKIWTKERALWNVSRYSQRFRIRFDSESCSLGRSSL